MSAQPAETQVAELDEANLGGFWGFWANNGTLVAVSISTIIQVILGLMLYLEGDVIGTAILCIPTCVIVPVVAYLHFRRVSEEKLVKLTEKVLDVDETQSVEKEKEDQEAAPASGDKPHEKEE